MTPCSPFFAECWIKQWNHMLETFKEKAQIKVKYYTTLMLTQWVPNGIIFFWYYKTPSFNKTSLYATNHPCSCSEVISLTHKIFQSAYDEDLLLTGINRKFGRIWEFFMLMSFFWTCSFIFSTQAWSRITYLGTVWCALCFIDVTNDMWPVLKIYADLAENKWCKWYNDKDKLSSNTSNIINTNTKISMVIPYKHKYAALTWVHRFWKKQQNLWDKNFVPKLPNWQGLHQYTIHVIKSSYR